MSRRKKLMRAEAGVRLERIERLSAQGRLEQTRYRLATLRSPRPQTLTTEREALDAFDLEVIASLGDPVVSRLIDAPDT